MLKTTYVCDSCHKEADKMLGITISVGDPQSYKTARFHVCSEECIPTAVKMSLLVAKEEPQNSYSVTSQNIGVYAPTRGLPPYMLAADDTSAAQSYWGALKNKLTGK